MNETITKMDSFKFFQIGIQCTIICTYMIHTLHVSNFILKDLDVRLVNFPVLNLPNPHDIKLFLIFIVLEYLMKDLLNP